MYESISVGALVIGVHLGQVTILALLVMVTTRFLKSKPYLCYGLLTLAILKCLTPPFVPGWGWYKLEIPSPQATTKTVAQHFDDSTKPNGQSDVSTGKQSAVENSGKQSGVSSRFGALPAVKPGKLIREEPVAANRKNRSTAVQNNNNDETAGLIRGWPLFVVSGYLLVSFCMLAVAIGYAVSFRFRIRETVTVNSLIDELFQRCLQQVKIKHARLVLTKSDTGPMAYGLLRPTVVIPQTLVESCTADELETIFLHELNHIKRRDIVLGWLQTIAVCLWWLNPVVWYLSACLSRWREYCCDLETMTIQNISSKEYCLRLLKASSCRNKCLFPVQFGVSPFLKLEQRMKVLMKNSNSPHRGMSIGLKAVLVLAACMVLPNVMGFGVVESTQPENFTNDTELIFYSSKNGTVEIKKGDFGTSRVFATPHNVSHGKVSPDGQSFAFVSWVDGKRQVWVCDRKGKSKAISPDHGHEFIQQIEWSPDGKTIAYRTQGSHRSAVYLVKPDGTEHRKLKPFRGKFSRGLQYYNDFCWSPSGQSLAIAKVVEITSNHFADMITIERKSVLQIHQLKTDKRKELFGIGQRRVVSNLAWSPDEKWVAFKSKYDLYIQDVAGKEKPKRLATRLNPGGFPRWSSDSQTILVHSSTGNSPAPPGAKKIAKPKNTLLLIRIDGKSAKKQISVPFYVWDYDWDGSGKSIVCTGDHRRLVKITTKDSSREILAEDVGFWGQVQIRNTAQKKGK